MCCFLKNLVLMKRLSVHKKNKLKMMTRIIFIIVANISPKVSKPDQLIVLSVKKPFFVFFDCKFGTMPIVKIVK